MLQATTRLFLLLILVLFMADCKRDAATQTTLTAIHKLEGETMGTYYRVSYRGAEQAQLKASLDSVLQALNQEVSTYIPTSFISRFNYGDMGVVRQADLQSAPHFLANLKLSEEIAEVTQGYFNITIMPLVNYWGFGYTSKKPITAVDSVKVDSLMAFVGLDKYQYDPTAATTDAIQLSKTLPGTQIDFSAVAKGYGVDLVASYMEHRGIVHYLVDIGGEAVAKGHKGKPEQTWRIGINTPQEKAALTDIELAIPLRDKAIATSGNYRNVYEVGDQKYSHTINPFTGYPERSNLLSTSIIANDCATADAYATACMVMGLERAFALIDSLPGLDACFIYSDEQGKLQQRLTEGFVVE